MEEQKTVRSQEEIQKEKNKRKRGKIIAEVILVIALAGLIILLFLQASDINEVGATFANVLNDNNWVYLLIALLLIIVYLTLWPMSLYSFTKALKMDLPLRDTIAVGNSEHFYSGITPFSVGGQPFQVYFLTKCGQKSSDSTGVIIATFAVHLIASNIFAIIALFFFPVFIRAVENGDISGLEWMNTTLFTVIVSIGYAMNILTLIFTFAMGLSKGLRNLFVKAMKALGKIKFLHKVVDKGLVTFEEYCDNTQLAFKEILHHPGASLLSLLFRILADLAYYSVPFFLMLAVGVDFSANPISSYFLVMLGTSFAITAVVFIPTPGASGGADYAFAIVVASLLVGGYASISTNGTFEVSSVVSLLWRLFTYYLVLFVSFIFSLTLQLRIDRRDKKAIKALEDEEKALTNGNNE